MRFCCEFAISPFYAFLCNIFTPVVRNIMSTEDVWEVTGYLATWVTRPKGLKRAKDKVKGPQGPPAGGQVPEAQTFILQYFVPVIENRSCVLQMTCHEGEDVSAKSLRMILHNWWHRSSMSQTLLVQYWCENVWYARSFFNCLNPYPTLECWPLFKFYVRTM